MNDPLAKACSILEIFINKNYKLPLIEFFKMERILMFGNFRILMSFRARHDQNPVRAQNSLDLQHHPLVVDDML